MTAASPRTQTFIEVTSAGINVVLVRRSSVIMATRSALLSGAPPSGVTKIKSPVKLGVQASTSLVSTVRSTACHMETTSCSAGTAGLYGTILQGFSQVTGAPLLGAPKPLRFSGFLSALVVS